MTDLAGNLVGRLASEGTAKTYPPSVMARIQEELEVLLTQLDIRRADVVGVGLAVAGRLDTTGGVLRSSPKATEWEDFAVQEALQAASGFTVILENDSARAALGEFWVGRIPATQDFATLYMATGIGCGIMIKRRRVRGVSSNAGEIGHMIVDVNGPDCWCGSKGCLEMLAAPLSLVNRAMKNAALAESLKLSGLPSELRMDFALIARAAAQGDKECTGLIEESATYIAKALISLTNLIDLDHLYLAGPVFAEAGSIYYRIIRDQLERLAFMRSVHPVHVELSEEGARICGAGRRSGRAPRQPHASSQGSDLLEYVIEMPCDQGFLVIM